MHQDKSIKNQKIKPSEDCVERGCISKVIILLRIDIRVTHTHTQSERERNTTWLSTEYLGKAFFVENSAFLIVLRCSLSG